MSNEFGINPRPRPAHTVENGTVPFPLVDDEATLRTPGPERLKTMLTAMYGELPIGELGSVLTVAGELLRNAEQHGRPTPGLLQAEAPDWVVTLAWAEEALSQERTRLYALIMVSDRNGGFPQVPSKMRSGFGRVIAATSRCGAYRTSSGKTVWALVETSRTR
ncbi:hypothetical protein E1281_19710 [Actinomadura sp. KC345]|uniref:hypothetical protein n=1 Tax=Actinomadura sp. KC345 TaxID=2530371 RepID=UPI0010440769|nr:hypothetical protein [Actinomadura sp. KC345]TDC51938.1 hypothetical protein E1281_19710 [Actinomadura sp. KC345]